MLLFNIPWCWYNWDRAYLEAKSKVLQWLPPSASLVHSDGRKDELDHGDPTIHACIPKYIFKNYKYFESVKCNSIYCIPCN